MKKTRRLSLSFNFISTFRKTIVISYFKLQIILIWDCKYDLLNVFLLFLTGLSPEVPLSRYVQNTPVLLHLSLIF